MIRCFAAAAVLLASPAYSGTGPEIAYVQAGNQDIINLINPDGTGARVLYKTPRGFRIFVLDMKPNGGELAFEEVSARSDGPATLKVIRYDDAGRVIETKTRTGCRILSLDYHPSSGELLYNDPCVRLNILNTTTMALTSVDAPDGINKAAWRGPDQLVYNRSTALASEVLVAPRTAPRNTTVVGEVRLAGTMDVSSSGSMLLVDPVDWATLSMFNMTTGIEQKDWQIGHYGRFSPDDTEVVYASGYDVRGSYLFIRKVSGPGSPFRLPIKGVIGPVDWRN